MILAAFISLWLIIIFLAWLYWQKHGEVLALRSENERLIDRIGYDYHFETARASRSQYAPPSPELITPVSSFFAMRKPAPVRREEDS